MRRKSMIDAVGWVALLAVAAAGCGGKDEKEGAAKGADKAVKTATGDEMPAGLTPEDAAKVVAKVGDHTITVGDVTRQINRLSPYIRRRWSAPEKRKEFLDKLIRVELLSQEAARLGLMQDPEVQRTVNQVMVRLMVKNDLEKELLPSTIDEATLKAEYEKEHDKYHRPAQIRASQIVVKTKAEAEKLIAEIKQNTTDTGFFRKKAREVSLDAATKDRGGDIGYFSTPAERREDEPVVPLPVAEVAWQIKNVGDLADAPAQSPQGFHVIKLTNKRAEMNRSFESVRRIIENRLLREKRREAMDKFIADLKTKAKVEIYEDNLAKLDTRTDLPVPPDHAHGGPVPAEAQAPGGQ